MAGFAGRDIGALGDVGADRQERRVEAAHRHRFEDVRDLGVELERHAEVEDALDLGIEHIARQPVFRNAEAHHAAGERPGLVDLDRMAEPAQMIGGRQAGRPGADHQHALAALGRRRREAPALPDRLVAEETLDRIDADRFVDLGAIAGAFARVIADAPHDRRQRIVLRQHAPGALVIAGFGVRQPALDVLARRAGVIAGRQAIDIDRAATCARSRCDWRGSCRRRA